MMVRTQITLDADIHRRAKHRAADLGISFAEYVRRMLDRDLGMEPKGDISEIIGLFDSGRSDIAQHKEQYLDEAARKEYLREVGRWPRRERAFEVRR
ncbi:MAG TPA: hypothetical protein VG147_01260 [Solirubrobacteraceae bacterium]|jgi:hypothetical protein|nr:hypothetical protein [Solirubrobacteraceae bacterium]